MGFRKDDEDRIYPMPGIDTNCYFEKYCYYKLSFLVPNRILDGIIVKDNVMVVRNVRNFVI